jgi:signal transduction histidine kinase/CHASE2 domain-containing sensor protein
MLTAYFAWSNSFDRLNLMFYDAFHSDYAPAANPDLVIVAIDDESVKMVGRWPWRRSLQATLLDRITADHPRAIGIDIIYGEPDDTHPGDDRALENAIARNGHVVLATVPGDDSSGYAPDTLKPKMIQFAFGLGHVNVEPDVDGIVRTASLYEAYRGNMLPHLAIELLRAGGANGLPQVPLKSSSTTPEDSPPARQYGRFYVPLPDAPNRVKIVSAVSVLEGQVRPADLAGKYVLVGVTTTGLGATLATPGGPDGELTGVEYAAAVMQAVCDHALISPLRSSVQTAIAIIPVLLMCIILIASNPTVSLIMLPVLIFTTLCASVLALSHLHLFFKPGASVIGSLLVLPTWIWLRHQAALTYLTREYDRMQGDTAFLASGKPKSIPSGDVVTRRINSLQAAVAHMRAQRQFLADGLENLPAATIVLSSEGTVLLANKHAEALAHARGQNDDGPLIGSLSSTAITRMTGDARAVAFVTSKLQDPLAQPPDLQTEPSEFEIATDDGNFLIIRCARVKANEIFGPTWIVHFEDVSAIRQTAIQRDQALNFLSHDLRAPVSSILALLEIESARVSTADRRVLFEQIRRYAERAMLLADDFLLIARTQNQPIVYRLVSLPMVLLDTIEDAWVLSRKRKQKLDLDIPEEAWVIGNATLLKRAAMNLVTNAIKYSTPGDTIKVTLTDAGHSWTVSVMDHGRGIGADDQGRLFAEFVQLAADPQIERGAGLGLAFVKTAIQKHGGTVFVDSEIGRGSTFGFTLPKADPDGTQPAG